MKMLSLRTTRCSRNGIGWYLVLTSSFRFIFLFTSLWLSFPLSFQAACVTVPFVIHPCTLVSSARLSNTMALYKTTNTMRPSSLSLSATAVTSRLTSPWVVSSQILRTTQISTVKAKGKNTMSDFSKTRFALISLKPYLALGNRALVSSHIIPQRRQY